jgi:hypothetical protein
VAIAYWLSIQATKPSGPGGGLGTKDQIAIHKKRSDPLPPTHILVPVL